MEKENKESSVLFQEWKDYEKSIMPFKVTSDLKSRIGKTVTAVYHDYRDGKCHDILTFIDGYALWKCEGDFESCISLASAWWFDKNSFEEGHASSYLTDYGYVLKSCGLISDEQVGILLEKAKVFREVQHKEDVKVEIQKRLDEISALKEEL